ncbi:MAG: hypothetical protein ACOX2F_02940 [bacterium]
MRRSEGFELVAEIQNEIRKFSLERNLQKEDLMIELSNHASCLIEKIPNNEIKGLSKEMIKIGIEGYLKKHDLCGVKAVINGELDKENKLYNIRERKD